MDELILRRSGWRLEPPTADWAELMEGLPEGVDLKCKITRPRSVKQLGTYWGVLHLALKNWPESNPTQYVTVQDLSSALQLAVGFADSIQLPGMVDIAYRVPRSKSFAECTQSAFNAYMDLAMRKLAEWVGYDPVDAYLAHSRLKKGAA